MQDYPHFHKNNLLLHIVMVPLFRNPTLRCLSTAPAIF
jgi:hypothetical protein